MVTVIPDIRSNSVVVSGTTDDLRLLHDLIEKVDVVLPQVRVEVVIAEVTLTDNDQNGISALGLSVTAGKLTGVNGTVAGGTVGANVNGTGIAGLAPNGSLTGAIGLSTTDRVNNYRVLSVPSVTTTHNKEATIFVGESDPVITGTTASTVNAGTTTSTVTMRDIGINLKILPLIGKDGSVQMQVSQSVEDIIRTTVVDGNEQPIIGRRTMDSYVSAMSGEIVVMGGLQRTTKKKVTTRLGPIPIIGDILGSTTDVEVRQELVIFMRPYVLNASAVDNLDALSRIDASSVGPEVRKFIDRAPGKPLPVEGKPAAPAAK
jgi:general secretion pathway protein D